MTMKFEIIISTFILSLAIVTSASLFFLKDEYSIELVEEARFLIKTNLRTGERCLLREGYVTVTENWKQYADAIGLPNNICN